MNRRRPARGGRSVGHGRWLVSYADLVTLLFALFVVLYASSQADRKKLEKVAKGFAAATGQTSAAIKSEASSTEPRERTGGGAGSSAGNPPGVDNLLAQGLTEAVYQATAELGALADSTSVKVDPESSDVRVVVQGIFAPGARGLAPEFAPLFLKLGKILDGSPRFAVQVFGYADSTEAEAWGVSSARAAAVTSLWAEKNWLGGGRMQAVGMGGTERTVAQTPAASAAQLDWARRASRRIEIVVHSKIDGHPVQITPGPRGGGRGGRAE